jgi:hypothetical protein
MRCSTRKRAACASFREFCRNNGRKESAFYFWRRGLAIRAGPPAQKPAEHLCTSTVTPEAVRSRPS